MNAIVIPGFLLLAGICIYAAVNHLSIALRHPFNPVHLLFAGMCALMLPFAITHTLMLQATTIAELIPALRWNLATVAVQLILFAWFMAAYTGVRPMLPLLMFSLLFLVLFVFNLLQPYTLQYETITGLVHLHLPWGEVLTLPEGRNSLGFEIGSIAVMLIYVFAFYMLVKLYRRGGKRTTLVMMVAIGIYLLTSMQGILVRLSIVDSVPLGAFGYLGMVIVMGMALSYETRQSSRRTQAILDYVPAVVYMKDLAGRYLMVNRHYEDMFHVGEEIVGKTDFELFSQTQANIFSASDRQVLAELRPIELEEVVDQGGEPHTFLAHKFPLFHANGTPFAVCGVATDITERKHTEEAIRHIAAGVSAETGMRFFHHLVLNLYKLFNADYVLIGMLDEHDRERVGTLAVCAYGKIVDNMSYGLHGTPCENVMDQGTCIYPHNVQQLFPEDKFLSEHGIDCYMGTPLLDIAGNPLGIIVMLDSKPMQKAEQIKDVLEIFAARAGAELERMRAETRIRNMAYEDYLTRLPNRALLHVHLADVLGRVRRANNTGVMLMIDLDHFKTINNALSHDVGDDVLREVARRLIEISGEQVFVARLGGDEFVVLMKSGYATAQEAEQHASALAENIMHKLSSPLVVGAHVLSVGASMGVALFPGDGETELDILRHAEMALYQAKGMGRNNIQFYLSGLQAGAEVRLKLEDGLRTAIVNNELELYFQPQVNASGQMIGAEALLRWHHPEMGDIPPVVFIPVAEETGLIHGIGAWVLEEACGKFARWLQSGVPFIGHLSINVCAWQFARPDFIDQLRHVLAAHKILPDRIMLEVTESALLYDLAETIAKLREIRALGVKVSLDDFGTGYSSLAYLKDLPLDELKIDKIFIDELATTQEHSLVETIIAIGRYMKLAVIAEGVESAVQRDTLAQYGCENFQGYFFARPLPEPDFLQWIVVNQHAVLATDSASR
jgi:diguanylate cyclase (GGDEF)-like protein/PAS domain S-box-containing protein